MEKSGVLSSGLSVEIAWLLCCGMRYHRSQEQADYTLQEVERVLEHRSAVTEEDFEALLEMLSACGPSAEASALRTRLKRQQADCFSKAA